MTPSTSAAPLLPVAGVELGGTKCVCTLGTGPGGIVAQHTVPTTSPFETLAAIEAVLDEWARTPGFRALGIGSFGPIDLAPGSPSYGHILATAKPGWPGTNVARRLGTRYGVPTGFDTDVNAAALAEIAWGAGRGLDDFAYVTVGTGVGVGLIVHGRATRGLGHSELGHVRVPRAPGDTAPSACPFHDDCVEGLASGSALRLRIGDRAPATLAPDDPVWDPIVHTLAQLAHILVCATGPFRIAMGGGVPTAQPHLLPRIETALRTSLNGYMTVPEHDYVVAPALGDQAGPLGTLALALDAETTRR